MRPPEVNIEREVRARAEGRRRVAAAVARALAAVGAWLLVVVPACSRGERGGGAGDEGSVGERGDGSGSHVRKPADSDASERESERGHEVAEAGADPAGGGDEAAAAGARLSPIKSDEEVVLFPVAAAEDASSGSWRAPVHGWIFEPEESDRLRELFMHGMREALGDDPGFSSELFLARLRPFLVDNERGKAIPVAAGGVLATSSPSQPNGHFELELEIPAAEVGRYASSPVGEAPPRVTVRALAREGDARRFESVAFLLPAQGLTLISDIDDTVKISEVRDTERLLRNTFLEPYRVVPGMAQTYARWLAAAPGSHLHFVSSSPWQLFAELRAMLVAAGFPEATFDLRTFRVLDGGLAELLADPTAAKTGQIEAQLRRFPQRRFALVGDSGEHDPEIYGAIARAHADQVVYVAIRDVSGEGADHPRYAAAFRDVKARWEVFASPESLHGP